MSENNQEQEGSGYLEPLRANFITGFFNGLMFSSSWALFYGPVTSYQKNIDRQLYLRKIRAYSFKSVTRLTPMCALAGVVSQYFEMNKEEYGETLGYCATFASCILFLKFAKFP